MCAFGAGYVGFAEVVCALRRLSAFGGCRVQTIHRGRAAITARSAATARSAKTARSASHHLANGDITRDSDTYNLFR